MRRMAENASERIVLTGISSRAWEHPADRGALVALRKIRGFDSVLRKISGFMTERSLRLLLLGSSVKVDTRQFPRVFRVYTQAATALDAEDLPDLYISANPFLNAMAVGLDRPVIVVNSGLIDLLDDDELRFVLGHELGHVGSGHALYRTMFLLLTSLSSTFLSIPFSYLGIRALLAALSEWSRKSELSADRAGLLACQDTDAALRVHMKLASGGHIAELDTDAFLEQAEEYAEDEDIRDLVLRVLLVENMTHPFAVVRAAELRRWVGNGEYHLVLQGSYPRRVDDADARLSDDVMGAAASYQDQFTRAEDTISRTFGDIANGMGAVGGWVAGRVRDATGTRPDESWPWGRDERTDRPGRPDDGPRW